MMKYKLQTSISKHLFFVYKLDSFDPFALKGKHSVGGPMTITQPKYSPGQQVWLEAGRELGFEVRDPNGPQTVGLYFKLCILVLLYKL